MSKYLDFKYEPQSDVIYELYGNLQIECYLASWREDQGYYSGREFITDIKLKVVSESGHDITASLKDSFDKELELIEQKAYYKLCG